MSVIGIPKLLVGTTLLASSGVGNLILVSAIQCTVYYTTTLCLWGITRGVKMIYRGSKSLLNHAMSQTKKADQSTDDHNKAPMDLPPVTDPET